MNRKKLIRIIGIVLLGGVILYGISLLGGEREPSWDPTWSGRDSDPFGTELLKITIEEFVKPAEFIVSNNSPEFILEEYWFERSAYLFVNNTFDPTVSEWQELRSFAEDGNILWVATESVSDIVGKSLGIAMLSPELVVTPDTTAQDSVSIYFTRQHWPKEPFLIPEQYLGRIIQTSSSTLLYEPFMISHSGDHAAVFIPIGGGGICISAFPKMISNYGLMDPDYEPMIAGLLSILPDDLETVYWDEWIKVGNRRRQNDKEAEDGPGPLSFIWQHEALRMALLLALSGIILALLFQTKRIQRIIPPSPPLSNTTLDFTDTVGRLYFQGQQHLQPAIKRISAFREYLTETYLLPENFGSDEFCKILAAKSGQDLKKVTRLIRTIERTESAPTLYEDQLQSLSEQIDSFIHP